MNTAAKITIALVVLNEVRGIAVAASLGPEALHSATTGTMPDLASIGIELLFLALGFLAIWAIRRAISAYRPNWVEMHPETQEVRCTVTEHKP